jgi:hypothetical protein
MHAYTSVHDVTAIRVARSDIGCGQVMSISVDTVDGGWFELTLHSAVQLPLIEDDGTVAKPDLSTVML